MPNQNLLNIFKPGSHRPSGGGEPITFSEADLRKAAEVYDPALHRAPIIIGHAKLLDPAYGHIKALSYSADGLEAEPEQVEPEFAALISKGAYPNISAGWYPPGHSRNPVGDQAWYLREVSFLGAVPPAVRNLRRPSMVAAFSADEDGIVRFGAESEYDDGVNAGLWRKLREWMIGKFGQDEADKVIPQADVQYLEQSAQAEMQEAAQEDCGGGQDQPMLGFAGSDARKNMSQADAALKAENERLQRELAAAKDKERERESAARRKDLAEFAESLCAPDKDGNARLLSKHKNTVVDLLMLASNPQPDGSLVEFGEGEDKGNALTRLKAMLADLPPVLNFAEQAVKNRAATPDGDNPLVADAKARASK